VKKYKYEAENIIVRNRFQILSELEDSNSTSEANNIRKESRKASKENKKQVNRKKPQS
jgi:hypothetical protein